MSAVEQDKRQAAFFCADGCAQPGLPAELGVASYADMPSGFRALSVYDAPKIRAAAPAFFVVDPEQRMAQPAMMICFQTFMDTYKTVCDKFKPDLKWIHANFKLKDVNDGYGTFIRRDVPKETE